jgi:hypothetical protein
MYPADGRKVFDIYTWPYSIRPAIKNDLGDFPFPCFWGPGAGVDSAAGASDAVSRWIAASARWMEEKHLPTLSLVYLPHLDYNLQRHGPYLTGVDGALTPEESRAINPAIHRDLREIDATVGGLLDFYNERRIAVVLVSEYGITNVNRAISLNRLFRQQGWLTVKEELGLALLDCRASKAFAAADHQVAPVYLNDSSIEMRVRDLLETTEGIASVLGGKEKADAGVDHPRAGDLIAVAEEKAWFNYYYWEDDRVAPDFARTVDIHRKPGYDPVELFTDPALPPLALKLKVATRLAQKKLGFRMLMDVIPLDASLVKGSHGCRPRSVNDYPVMITDANMLPSGGVVHASDVYHILKRGVLP